jgi:hypothetical protein
MAAAAPNNTVPVELPGDSSEYKLRKQLLLLDALVVSVTYVAGLEPPGGVWKEDGGDGGGGVPRLGRVRNGGGWCAQWRWSCARWRALADHSSPFSFFLVERSGATLGVRRGHANPSEDAPDFHYGGISSDMVLAFSTMPQLVVRVGCEQKDGRFGEGKKG